MRIWGLLYLLSFSTGLMAGDHLVYPMKKGNHWGLVNSKGNFKVAPNYDLYVAREMKGLYALLKRIGESDSAELVVYDSLGHQILYNKDSILTTYGRYRPRNGKSWLDEYVMNLYGHQPLPIAKSSIPAKPRPRRYQHEYRGQESEPYDIARHRERIGENEQGHRVFRVTFSLPQAKPEYNYSYLKKVNDSLYMANKGGELEMTFIPSSSNGCVVTGAKDDYGELKGGYWGIVSAGGRIVEPFVHKDELEIKPFGLMKYSYSKGKASILIVHSPLSEGRSGEAGFTKVKVLDQSGVFILEREGRGLKSHGFGLFGRTVVKMASDNFNEFYLMNTDGAVQDTFDGITISAYGNYGVLKKGTWTLYDQYHQKVTADLDVLTREPAFLNDLYIKERQGDSTRILNVFTNQARWVPTQHVFEFSGDYVKYIDAFGKRFIYSISQGRVIAEASKLDKIPLDDLVWYTNRKGQSVIAIAPWRNCDFPVYQNALELDGYACLLNDSFILNQQGTWDTLLGGKFVGGLGSLSVKDRSYSYGINVYHEDHWSFYARQFTLSEHKNFALIDIKPRYEKRLQTIWFPKANRVVALKHFKISEHWDFGSCLLLKGRGNGSDADWLLFNEKGRLISVDTGWAPPMKRLDPKRVNFYAKAYQKKHRSRERRKYGY